MPSLAEKQRVFAAAIMDAGLPVPAGVVGPDREESVRRFSVYRNNVVLGLVGTLKDAFPAVQRIVGSEFFQAMARAYVAIEPPRSPMMFDYGAGFPDFIQRFEPGAVLPYLADVARIERAWSEAYHAADVSPIDADAFSEVRPDRLPAMSLVLHPSVRTVRSRFPALSIWRMNIDGGVPAPVDLEAGGEDVLVLRPTIDVEVRFVPDGSVDFIRALGDGQSVLAAFKTAVDCDPAFDLLANLSDLIRVGALIGYRLAS